MMLFSYGFRQVALILLVLTSTVLLKPEIAHARQVQDTTLISLGEDAPPQRGAPNFETHIRTLLLLPESVPIDTSRFSFRQSYPVPDNCHVVELNSISLDGANFAINGTRWIFPDTTLTGNSVTRTFPGAAYYPFTMVINGTSAGQIHTITLEDSVHVNQPPTAWAGGNRQFIAGTPIVFDGTVSEDPDGRIIRYEWDFGDGSKGLGARVDHTYTQPGAYTVVLTVTDNSGSPCATAVDSVIVRMNRAPIARINAPANAQSGDTITLDASESFDPDGSVLEYLWEINDVEISREPVTSYTLTSNRNLNVRLTVTDDAFARNSTSTVTHGVRVSRGPVANAGDDKHISPNRPPVYNANRSRATDGTIVKYEWFFPQDIVREGMIVREPIAEPGEYYILLRVTDSFGMTDMDSLFVRVNFPPEPVITGDLIVNNGTVSLSAEESFDTDGEIISYEWSMGDGTRISGPVANHTYAEPGTYTVQLTVIDDSGTFSSVQSAIAEVVFKQLPIARINAPGTGSPDQALQFDATASSDPDGEISRYTWDFGDGNTAEGSMVTHQFEKPGVYRVKLTVFDNTPTEPSVGYTYTEITIQGPPQLIARAPDRAAPGTTFEIDLSDTQTPGSDVKAWYWFTNNQWVEGDYTATFIMPADGEKNVRFAVENTSGLPNSRAEGEIVIAPNHPPQIAALRDVITHEPHVSFDVSASTDPDGDEIKFSWDFGDGNTAEGSVVTHTFDGPGEYTVNITADDRQGLANSSVTKTLNVLINREPQIVMTFPEVVCKDTPVAYAARAGSSQNVIFNWDFGNGETSERTAGSLRFNTPGNYTVTLRADDQLGLPNSQSQVSRDFIVAGSPVAKAGDPVAACLTESVVFDGSASISNTVGGEIARFVWDFGDGNTAEGMRISHRYESPGVYTATLKVECSLGTQCSDERAMASRTVTVASPAIAAFSIPEIMFAGDELLLDASESVQPGQQITRFRWELSTGEEIVWELRNAGSNRAIWEQRSGRRIAASVSANELQGRLPLTRVSPRTGNHTIRLHVETGNTLSCNSAALTRRIEVSTQPNVRIAQVPVLTPDQRFRFTLVGNSDDIAQIQQPVWVSNGVEFEGARPLISWDTPGTYRVQLFDRSIESISSRANALLDEATVRVNAPPVPVITGPSLVSRGDTTTFTAESSTDADGQITRFEWVTSNGIESERKTLPISFDRPGTFTVTLTVTDNDNVANSRQSVSKEIQVIAPDMLEGTIPAIVCLADPLDLPKQLGLSADRFANLTVRNNDRTIPFDEVTAINFETVGQQHLVITSAEGTVLLDSRFEVYEPPVIEATIPQTFALNRSNGIIMFDASQTASRYSGGVRIFWEFGDGNTAAGQLVRHRYQRPGTYTVTVTATSLQDLPCNTSTRTYEIIITDN